MEQNTEMMQKEKSSDQLMDTAEILQLEEQLRHAKQQVKAIGFS